MSEQGNYLLVSLKAENAIIEAIALLKTEKTLYADADRSREIVVEIAEFEADRAKIHAKRLAYIAGKTKIKPPSDADFKKVEELAKKIDGMIANAENSKAAIKAATEIIETWNETNKPV